MLTKNIYFTTYLNSYEIIKIKKLNILERNLIKLRSTFLETIKIIYPKEEAIFL